MCVGHYVLSLHRFSKDPSLEEVRKGLHLTKNLIKKNLTKI